MTVQEAGSKGGKTMTPFKRKIMLKNLAKARAKMKKLKYKPLRKKHKKNRLDTKQSAL
jgi:hypothetical protein